jgi:hypothetical protein
MNTSLWCGHKKGRNLDPTKQLLLMYRLKDIEDRQDVRIKWIKVLTSK